LVWVTARALRIKQEQGERTPSQGKGTKKKKIRAPTRREDEKKKNDVFWTAAVGATCKKSLAAQKNLSDGWAQQDGK